MLTTCPTFLVSVKAKLSVLICDNQCFREKCVAWKVIRHMRGLSFMARVMGHDFDMQCYYQFTHDASDENYRNESNRR